MKKVQSLLSVIIIFASISVVANNHLKGDSMNNLKSGINKVTFKSFGVNLVGNLYLPEGFDANKKYIAIVGASPFPQVKEQVLATYGPEMAKRGFVFLAFDYLGMGDSPALPGEFKKSRYMFRLIENTWDAVSYLGSLPFVEEINGLGVCQGGSIIASAAVTDHRIKKIALISGMMAADDFQWTNKEMVNQQIAASNASKQKMYETGKADIVAPFGMTDDQSREEYVKLAGGNPMAGESYDYYGRDGYRGPKAVENFSNLHIADQGMQSLFSLCEHYADKIVQPSLVIYSKTAFTAVCSTKFVEKLTNEHKVMALKEFGHVDFYYKAQAVKISADATAEFFAKQK
ncbi:MAG: alpha/beta hydrolase [Marinifilaceae bacterium]|jgi:fermentation-respiration switch protein FrsA (DUF1100 family)|nr:alpha/beta hydrolase [Marinifilaceae bacterium]